MRFLISLIIIKNLNCDQCSKSFFKGTNLKVHIQTVHKKDASAPTKRRGKEREKPKRKKPTTLKKLILQDREKRNLERQLNLILSAEKQKDIETVLIVDQKPEIVSNSDDLAKNIHENILKEPQIIELPQHSVQEKAKLQIHSRKFRR